MERESNRPIRLINSVAPIRICDNGGWTDTWFAEYGKVFNIAVQPFAEVQIAVYDHKQKRHPVTLRVANYGDHYPWKIGSQTWERHPLLEATLNHLGVPEEFAVEIDLHSDAPSGAGTGTSAAVTVAMIAALGRLKRDQRTPYQIASAAQFVETELLTQQCGIQDQLASAFGGINYIEMHEYPHAKVVPIQPPASILWELDRRLALVYLGRSHRSSAIHEKVIRSLENAGPANRKLAALRATAEPSRDALLTGDFAALGRTMISNTEAQRELHSDLVSNDAQLIFDIAKEHGAVGWKVNGAGGDGGSVTILCDGRSHAKRHLLREITEESSRFSVIPIRLSPLGVRSWTYELSS